MSSNIRAYTCHYRFGWGWYYSHFVDDDANGQISLLRVAGTADGGEFAVWYKITSDGNRIYANRLANQNPYAVWETPQALTDSITVFDIALSVDALGNAIVIWVQPDFPHNRLFTRRYTPGLGWDTVQLIDNNTGHCEASPNSHGCIGQRDRCMAASVGIYRRLRKLFQHGDGLGNSTAYFRGLMQMPIVRILR